jgi:low temperature requirement protein LtrA
MSPRTVDESNRTATPLELLFDLSFVTAVAQLAAHLAHDIASGRATTAIGPFLMVFFAIWWAWMNFTWFASAYDCDDVAYRLAAFVQIGGVLVLAAGTGRAFEDGDYIAIALGYLIMRLGLLALWIRAAVQYPPGRGTSLRYAGGIALLEVLWLSRLALGEHAAATTFLVLVLLELLVPPWAERRGATSWHPHHIAERYSLFTIILLGESVFAATTAVVAIVERAAGPDLVVVSAVSLVIIAALWWLYFAADAGADLAARREYSYFWGYGHYLFFAALAALGAGLEVVVAASAGHTGDLPVWGAVAAVAAPVAVILAMISLLQIPDVDDRPRVGAATTVALLVLIVIVAAADHTGLVAGVSLVAATVTGVVLADINGPSTGLDEPGGLETVS